MPSSQISPVSHPAGGLVEFKFCASKWEDIGGIINSRLQGAVDRELNRAALRGAAALKGGNIYVFPPISDFWYVCVKQIF